MNLTSKQKACVQVLKSLAEQGPSWYYELYHDRKVASNKTVLKCLHQLDDSGLIEVKNKREPSGPGSMGREKTYYGLTFRGLIAALKIGEIKLDSVRDRDGLVSSWLKRARKIDSEFKISEIFGLVGTTRDEKMKVAEEMFIEAMKKDTEEIEKFLKHYDVENSEDDLIFREWMMQVFFLRKAGPVLNRAARRQLKKTLHGHN